MPQFFKGINTTIFSLLLICSTFAGLIYFPQIWTPWFSLITSLLPITLAITAIFSAYFNHSRITLLASVFLLITISQTFSLPWSDWLSDNKTWLILQNLFLLVGLSFVKDRGLISVHGLHRLFLFATCGALAYGWQYFDAWVIAISAQEGLGQFQFAAPWISYLLIKLPAALVLLILLWRSVTQASSFSARRE